jgi:glycosyltransferase involved in cell wall biosynthesis
VTRDITYTGALDVKAVAKLLAGAMVSIVPSLGYENLPNALLESYAAGTPVVASEIGSLKEHVVNGVTGFTFPPGDSMGLALRLDYCLANRDTMLSMGRSARAFAEQNYSERQHVQQLLALFEEQLSIAKQGVQRGLRSV